MFLGVGTLQGPFDVNPTFYCFLYNGYGYNSLGWAFFSCKRKAKNQILVG